MDTIKQIVSIPLFHGLSSEDLKDLSAIVIEQVVKRGQEIFSEGDEGKGFYVVISGRVKIFKLSLDGKEQILHILVRESRLVKCRFLREAPIRRMLRLWKRPVSFIFLARLLLT